MMIVIETDRRIFVQRVLDEDLFLSDQEAYAAAFLAFSDPPEKLISYGVVPSAAYLE